MSSNQIHRYIIAYDIASDTRRARVAATLESYGDRVQYSVFLIDAKPAKLVRLRAALRANIDPVTDSILVCDLGPLGSRENHRIDIIGSPRPSMPGR